MAGNDEAGAEVPSLVVARIAGLGGHPTDTVDVLETGVAALLRDMIVRVVAL